MTTFQGIRRTGDDAAAIDVEAHGIHHRISIRMAPDNWKTSVEPVDGQSAPETAEAMASTGLLRKAVEAAQVILTPDMPLNEVASLVCYGIDIDLTPKEFQDLLDAAPEPPSTPVTL